MMSKNLVEKAKYTKQHYNVTQHLNRKHNQMYQRKENVQYISAINYSTLKQIKTLWQI